MAHKLAIALLVCALLGVAYSTGPSTQTATTNAVSFTPTTSSFVFAPTTSWAMATTADTATVKGGSGNLVMYGNSSDSAYCYLYQIRKGSETTVGFILYRRKLFSANFTTTGTSGDEASTETTTGAWPLLTPQIIMTTTTDQVAWASYDSTTATIQKITVCSAKSSVTPTCVLSAVVGADITPSTPFKSLWCSPIDGQCHLLFTTGAAAAAKVYRVFAFSSAAALQWSAASVLVYTQTAVCPDSAGVLYGNSTNASLATQINVAYRTCTGTTYDLTGVGFNTLKTSDGTLGTAKTMGAATAATKYYTPIGGFYANTTNGLILGYTDTATPTYTLHVGFSGTEATLTSLNVSQTAKKWVMATGGYYTTGFFLIATAGDTNAYTTYYNTYNSTGYNLTNGGLTLGTQAYGPQTQWWVTANGTLCFGYQALADDIDGKTVSASAGAIASSIWSTSGNVLASFVAFVALMVASLFAF